jgi:hypothetical protein
MTGSIEILAHFVARSRSAVTNKSAAVGKCKHKTANFGGEGMMLPIAGSVQPQNLPG